MLSRNGSNNAAKKTVTYKLLPSIDATEDSEDTNANPYDQVGTSNNHSSIDYHDKKYNNAKNKSNDIPLYHEETEVLIPERRSLRNTPFLGHRRAESLGNVGQTKRSPPTYTPPEREGNNIY